MEKINVNDKFFDGCYASNKVHPDLIDSQSFIPSILSQLVDGSNS
jgi:hypothetical protein